MLSNKKADDFSEWFLELVQKAELMDYSPVQGCMVIRENAYFVWQKMQDYLNALIYEDGVRNTYFPLFIPESFLKKEAEHFKGFAPEVAWVTHGGNAELGERLAIRPTSETIMYYFFSKWISSPRDLPFKINQWCNVVRWDTKALKPFLRTREFLWQEGHTAHATREEADAQAMRALGWYKQMCEELLALPVISGKKSEAEKFPGADYTTTIEALMPDGKALQAGTSHQLGQNFAKMFNVKYKTASGGSEYCYQTSWGSSTRLLGALAGVHGDDKGLVLPPRVAFLQVVLVPIAYSPEDKKMALTRLEKLASELKAKSLRVRIDDREDKTPGFKYNEWESKGVPLRIEVGLKDLANQGVTVARRDTGEKDFVSDEKIIASVLKTLDEIHVNLLSRAKRFMEENTHSVKTFDEFKKLMDASRGFVKTGWCEDARCEEAIKEETGATIRVIPFDAQADGKCVYCSGKAKTIAFFARSY